MLFIGYEYKDAAGNCFKSEFANISVHIEEKQTLQVSFTENISKLSGALCSKLAHRINLVETH